MNSSLVSVIVPVHNTEQYLTKCIGSIEKQSYYNIEIICVDDGSTDGSLGILRELEKKDERIHVISQVPKGVSAARNLGLKNAHGEFFCFVDSDDYIDEDMIAALVNNIQNNSADIGCCSYYLTKNGRDTKTISKKEIPEGPISSRKALKYVYRRDEYKAMGGYVVTRIFRKNTFCKRGEWMVRFDESIHNGEDVIFLAECHLLAKTISFTNMPYYHYVYRDDSASNNYMVKIDRLGNVPAYQKVINILENANIDDEIVIYVKRFLVYHASLLLENANKLNYHCMDKQIKEKIREYFPEYFITNISNIERVIHVYELLHNID